MSTNQTRTPIEGSESQAPSQSAPTAIKYSVTLVAAGVVRLIFLVTVLSILGIEFSDFKKVSGVPSGIEIILILAVCAGYSILISVLAISAGALAIKQSKKASKRAKVLLGFTIANLIMGLIVFACSLSNFKENASQGFFGLLITLALDGPQFWASYRIIKITLRDVSISKLYDQFILLFIPIDYDE